MHLLKSGGDRDPRPRVLTLPMGSGHLRAGAAVCTQLDYASDKSEATLGPLQLQN